MTEGEFQIQFKGSLVKRAKRRGLLRNAAAALSERDDDEVIAALTHALGDHEPLVRDEAKRSLDAIQARQLGRKGGRKRQMTDSKIETTKKLLAKEVPPRDVANNLGVSVPTLYRWVPAPAQA